MAFNWDLRVPFLYRTTYISLRDLATHMEGEGYEWAATRRHLALLHSRGGKLGFGGGWRKCPSNTSPASQRCESFHQDQEFSNGHIGPTAIDYVWEDGPDPGDWHDGVPLGGVPVQGSDEALVFGIHANVGTPGEPGFESWHGQPVEFDGWQSWVNAGRPFPRLHYPLPPEHDPDYDGGDIDPEDLMEPFIWRDTRYRNAFLVQDANAITLDQDSAQRARDQGIPSYTGTHDQMLKSCRRKAGLDASDLVPA